jgi:hypothetical protein
VVAGGGRLDRGEAVDVDADVVIVDVLELGALDGVELHSNDAVARAAVGGAVEDVGNMP